MWNIQVHNSESPVDLHDEYVKEGNVLERALEVSKLYPEQLVTVWGFVRMRYRIKNGKVIQNQSNYDHYYTIDDKEDLVSALIFAECIPYDSDNEKIEELLLLDTDDIRNRIMEVLCPKETREDPEMFEVWYRCRMRHYFY